MNKERKKERTLNDEVTILVKDEINQIAYPTECEITHIYTDGKVDIISTLYGEVNYIETHGKTPTIGDRGILIFLENNYDKRRVII